MLVVTWLLLTGGILVTIVAFCLLCIAVYLHSELEEANADARKALDMVHARIAAQHRGLEREQQLAIIARHALAAITHAENGDHDLVAAMLSECIRGPE